MSLRFGWKAWGRGVGFFFVFLMASHFESKADEGKVGEIRYSILTLEQFQELYGPEWEFMAGQSLSEDSELLKLWGKEKLPDARGVFLRSANHGRNTSEGNPRGNKIALGFGKMDEFKSHNHGGGNHNHGIQCELDASRNPNGGCYNTLALYHPKHKTLHSEFSGNIIQTEGGLETCPRYVVVNTYIKVKEPTTVQAITSESITPEIMKGIIVRPEFEKAVESAVKKIMDQRKR